MKKFLLISGIAALTALSAAAGTVTYTTVGSFSCGSILVGCATTTNAITGGSTITIGSSELVYTAGGGTVLLDPPVASNIGLGTISNALAGGIPPGPAFDGATLTIGISQTSPTSGTGNLVGNLAGQFVQSSSGATLTFSGSGATAVIGSPGGFELYTGLLTQIPASTTGTASTSVNGTVTDTSTPEPTTVLLVGAGLGCLGLVRRRRVVR